MRGSIPALHVDFLICKMGPAVAHPQRVIVEVKLGGAQSRAPAQGQHRYILAALTMDISSTPVRTNTDSEHLARWCRLGIRQTWV